MHIPKIGGKEREREKETRGEQEQRCRNLARTHAACVCLCVYRPVSCNTQHLPLPLCAIRSDSPCPGPCLSSLAEDNRKKHPSSILSFSLGCVGTKGGKQSGQDKGENNGSQLDNSTGQYNNTGKQVRSARQRDKETTQYNTTPIVLHRL